MVGPPLITTPPPPASSLLIESSILGTLLGWQRARVVVQIYLNQLRQLPCAGVLSGPGMGLISDQ